ncbi:cytochrome c-550 PedF [Methylobacterium brachythecii]|uniref:Cytochrome c-550 PedF n=1 Tax=Methylobacterium brachythecii TaxID=1176177 RepID=A0A7W6F6K4_9HYPH|nr:cytochrome c-550 PedF [Methylobacterium brachythecii]MBB3902464.1 cytochrome c-550 PedF [Methylobacterium brachythecii]GLS42312.1 cytochrome c-550 PedF [Methylobacterium brachythecii]
MTKKLALVGSVLAALVVSTGAVFSHGDVQPQEIKTDGLENLGDEWKNENPYRGNETAIKIGASGYNQNCARCHGLEVISGGLAPDLRYLEKGKDGDEWFKERVTHGAIINGVTKMPVFAGVLSQEGLWAIRSYLESKHEEQ